MSNAENFVVSALKYRPQLFDTVVGQQHITTTLKNAIKTGQLAHSFLFCGPRGVGKTTCARILAKTLNCTNRTADAEACDTCESCNAFKNNASFNVHELDAASNNSVDDIRDLTEQVRFLPQGNSKYKVYIIDEVHMLSSAAFNAFLKTLEEPPAHAIFILATTEKHKILPTILSRCQIFDFKRITTKDTVTHLLDICKKENISVEEDALHFIASKSEGCMRDSLSIMDKIVSFGGGTITYAGTIENLNILDYDYYFKLTDAIAQQDLTNTMLMYDDILAKGFEGDMFMNGFADHFRNLLVCKDAAITHLMDIAQSVKKKYYTQANSISNSLIINALSILNSGEQAYKQARNKRLHVELILIKLCHLTNAIQIISDDEGVFKKKVTNNFITPLIKKASASLQIDTAFNTDVVPKTIHNSKESAMESSSAKATLEIPLVPLGKIIAVEENATDGYGISAGAFAQIKLKAQQILKEKASQQRIEITAENVRTVWDETILHLAEGKDFFTTALKNCVVVPHGNGIEIAATDMMAYEFLQTNKLSTITYLKEYYSNFEMTVTIIKHASMEQEKQVVKSRKELFDDFALRFPIVGKMKNDLGLEFDL
jgi:DNA polymerase III subunit gamma/tau